MNKKIWIGTLLFLGVALMSFTFLAEEEKEKYPTIENGTEMPKADLKMLDVSGKELSLNDIKKENGTLVVFSCNTCPFVVMWEDRYDDMEQIANRLNIGVAIINSNEAKRDGDDSYGQMLIHAEEQKYLSPYLVDEKSKLADAFGAKTTPHIFLFDGDDVLVYQGAIDDNYNDYSEVTEKYIQSAMYSVSNGEEVAISKTDAKGCSIKRK
ncbi:MAG: redoxin domain-containing protein [Chitinophagales bacterium]